jgi:RNA polymerase sigma-B factor
MSSMPVCPPDSTDTFPTDHPSGAAPRLTAVGHRTPREIRDAQSRDLATALAACTDPAEERQLRDSLVVVNMPVAEALAGRYARRGESREDLQQVAYLALTSAAKRYDAHQGTPFAGYCVPTVLGEIKRHFRDRGWVVRPPRRVQELQAVVSRAQHDLGAEIGRPPSPQELADEVGSPLADVAEALAVRDCYHPTSLDRPVGEDQGSFTLGDLLVAPDAPLAAVEARATLAPSVSRLGERDRRILQLRFFDGLTQREIAEDIGVTQMQVSRLLSRIFDQVRAEVGQP